MIKNVDEAFKLIFGDNISSPIIQKVRENIIFTKKNYHQKILNLFCFALTTNTYKFFCGRKELKMNILSICNILIFYLQKNHFKYQIYYYLKTKIQKWSPKYKSSIPKKKKYNLRRWTHTKKNKNKELLNKFKVSVAKKTKIFLYHFLNLLENRFNEYYNRNVNLIINFSKKPLEQKNNWFCTQEANTSFEQYIDSL
jgi:hypothetical protein